MLASAHFTGSIWPALLVCYGIPVLINGLRLRLYGVVMTLVTLVAIHTFVVALATVVQVSLWIMMAMALASPLIAWPLSTIIGKYQHTHKGRWVLAMESGYIYMTDTLKTAARCGITPAERQRSLIAIKRKNMRFFFALSSVCTTFVLWK